MADILWLCPVPQGTVVTQTFAQHPGTDKGIDFGGDGLPVCASRSGTVISVVNNVPINGGSGWGNLVKIDHGNGYTSLYGHLRPNILVSKGQTVKCGEQIAWSDNSGVKLKMIVRIFGRLFGLVGYSTGPHVHFRTDLSGKPFDPYPFMRYTVAEVEGEIETPQELPEFPELPVYRIVARPSLYIRKSPGVSYGLFGSGNTPGAWISRLFARVSRLYGGIIVGSIPYGTELLVMGASWLGSDMWLQIGHEQHIAGIYRGVVMAERKNA